MYKIVFNHLEYTVEDTGVAYLSSSASCDASEIIVPEFIANGIPVVGISEKAFYKCDTITSVTLPYTLKEVGEYAFAWCSSLESIVLCGVETIRQRAFMGCGKLKHLYLPSSLCALGDKAFAHCVSLGSVWLPDNCSVFGEAVFEGCHNLTSASLPKNLKILPNGIFYACTGLESLDMPERLEYIDEYAFAYCISLNLPHLSRRTVINKDAFYECGIA